MTQNSAKEMTSFSVKFRAAEKRMLIVCARAAGQTLEVYIRERVIGESGFKRDVFRFLVNELSRSGDEAHEAIEKLEQSSFQSRERREARGAHIAQEVRESFTQREFIALATLFESAP